MREEGPGARLRSPLPCALSEQTGTRGGRHPGPLGSLHRGHASRPGSPQPAEARPRGARPLTRVEAGLLLAEVSQNSGSSAKFDFRPTTNDFSTCRAIFGTYYRCKKIRSSITRSSHLLCAVYFYLLNLATPSFPWGVPGAAGSRGWWWGARPVGRQKEAPLEMELGCVRPNLKTRRGLLQRRAFWQTAGVSYICT